MNEYDSERVEHILKTRGMERADSAAAAELVILNTCSVREKPQHKVSSVLGQLRVNTERTGLPVKTGVMGCVAQQTGHNFLKRNSNVDFVLGTDALDMLPGVLDRVENGERVAYTQWSDDEFEIPPFARTNMFSAFVTIMKGCNNYCSYCIVPYVRGVEKSRNIKDIISEVAYLAESGIKEITLLGQNVNSYSDPVSGCGFPELLARAAEVDGVKRLRFLTSHPKDFSREMASVMGSYPNICPNIHLPLQAGSDNVLKLMNRRYTVDSYMEKVAFAKELVPGIEFSSDFIVGFPGETDVDFEQTLRAVSDVKYETLFVFNYSVRPGTKAEKMADDVPLAVKTARLQEINRVQDIIMKEKYTPLLGNEMNVLVTGVDGVRCSGRTVHNRIINFTSDKNVQAGDEVNVTLTEIKKNTLFGQY